MSKHQKLLSRLSARLLALVLALGVVSGQPIHAGAAQLTPAKKMSTGASGQVKYGFNIHAFPMKTVAPMFQQVGANVLRIGASYGQYMRAGNSYPGKNNSNQISQATIDAAAAAGMDVVLALITPAFPVSEPSMAQWPAFVEAVAAANAKNGNVIFEIGNEPNTEKVTAQQYFDLMKLTYPAIKNGNPNARIAVPVINASYTESAKKFVAQLMAMPGVFDLFDYGDFHPYYNTPEKSFLADVDPFIKSIDVPGMKAGKSPEIVISEAGWTDAVGALAAIGGKARKTSETHMQTTDVAADYYSRYIPITRASHNVRTVTFYSLVDEGPPDPDKKNVQGHFGVFVDANTPKPSVAVAKELFDHMRTTVGAEMYTRSGTSGQEDTTADWFVRLDTAQSHELVAWTTVPGGRSAQVVVNAQQPGTLSIKVPGASSANEVTLTQGEQVVTVPLGARSVILYSTVPVTFPEFK